MNHSALPGREPAYRSKTFAAWLALLLGSLGVHRLYLHGARDRLAWCHPLPTLLGAAGVLRFRSLGQDDHLSWLLIPLIGLMLSMGALTAIVYALMPDEKWDARHNPGQVGAIGESGASGHAAGWGAVFAAIAGLLLGGTVLMGTIAFSGEKFFEWQFEDAPQSTKRLKP